MSRGLLSQQIISSSALNALRFACGVIVGLLFFFFCILTRNFPFLVVAGVFSFLSLRVTQSWRWPSSPSGAWRQRQLRDGRLERELAAAGEDEFTSWECPQIYFGPTANNLASLRLCLLAIVYLHLQLLAYRKILIMCSHSPYAG